MTTKAGKKPHVHEVTYIFRHAGWGFGPEMPEHWSHECECGFVLKRVPVYPKDAIPAGMRGPMGV